LYKHASINRVYKLVWNYLRRMWVPVPEHKSACSGKQANRKQQAVLSTLALAMAGLVASTLSGDSGLFVSAELRELLPAPPAYVNVSGQWFASFFIEAARAKINQRPWDTGTNAESLSGAGLGFNWLGPDNWRASLSWGRPLGSVPSSYVGSKRVNAWFELAKGFR
jgi:hypothetical protein